MSESHQNLINIWPGYSPVILWPFFRQPQNNCNRRFFTAKRLISIPRMTYQNFTPMERWEIYFFEVQRTVLFFVLSGVILHYRKSTGGH